MKMRIMVTCPKCGKQWEDSAYVREFEMNGGTIDTDCCFCGSVIDEAPFKVIGPIDSKA